MALAAAAAERFNLGQHPNAAVRELTARVLAGEASFPLSTADHHFRIVTASVPVAGWHQVELRELP